MEQIKNLTFEKACEVKGYKVEDCIITVPPMFPARHAKAMEAINKLIIMVDAANQIANDGKEWKADFTDDNWKYHNWYEYIQDEEGGSSGFRYVVFVHLCSSSDVGSRLCFISREVGISLGDNEEFMNLWNDFALYR
jgi:hypothetical protein